MKTQITLLHWLHEKANWSEEEVAQFPRGMGLMRSMRDPPRRELMEARPLGQPTRVVKA
jgi:hypothetical protein